MAAGQEINRVAEWMRNQTPHGSYAMSGYPMTSGGAYLVTSPPIKKNVEQLERDRNYHNISPASTDKSWAYGDSELSLPQMGQLPPLRPNRRNEFGRPAVLSISTRSNSRSNLRSSVHPMVFNWRSPIGNATPFDVFFFTGFSLFFSLEFGYTHNLTFQRP